MPPAAHKHGHHEHLNISNTMLVCYYKEQESEAGPVQKSSSHGRDVDAFKSTPCAPYQERCTWSPWVPTCSLCCCIFALVPLRQLMMFDRVNYCICNALLSYSDGLSQ
jgi:hypothetical protein